jgi:hypothetical protein
MWKYIAYTEFVILVILIFILIKNKTKIKSDFEKAIINDKTKGFDMDELILDISKSRSLYKELSKKYHPDLFVNSEIHNEINMLFQEITKHKSSYSELLKLKETAENKFNIKILWQA